MQLSQHHGVELKCLWTALTLIVLHRVHDLRDCRLVMLNTETCVSIDFNTDLSANSFLNFVIALKQTEDRLNGGILASSSANHLDVDVDDSLDGTLVGLYLNTENDEHDYSNAASWPAKLDYYLKLSERSGVFGYKLGTSEPVAIEHWTTYVGKLLQGMANHPEISPWRLPMLSADERETQLVAWNDTTIALADTRYIQTRIASLAQLNPDQIAVSSASGHITYRELNKQANQLARHLGELGVKPEELVGICMERSIDLVVALLAVIKAGGAYVPVDPAYPKERLREVLSTSQFKALITRQTFTEFAPKTLATVALNNDAQNWRNQSDQDLNPNEVGLQADNLIYAIFTSGSTGKPKLVGIEHRSAQNQVSWYVDQFDSGYQPVGLLVTSFAFDASQTVILGLLSVGGRLVLADEPFDPFSQLKQIASERVTLIDLTPSAFHALIEADSQNVLQNLRQILLGGEAMRADKLVGLPQPRPTFYNTYGPTECTVQVTCFPVTDIEQFVGQRVPIGKPVYNTRAYILDEHLQLLPAGAIGELYIGGIQVGRGYLNRPELTDMSFVPDPFTADTQAKMYKTGDRARWLPDGTIDFIGRDDAQIKLRGFRIELGEIEAVICEYPGILDAVVILHTPASGNAVLVAYYTTETNLPVLDRQLISFLKDRLPHYMLPTTCIKLDEFPLTPNGKLERKYLPIPDVKHSILDSEFVAPQSTLQQQLLNIWRTFLKVEQLGIHDNFFERGGHSLIAVAMIIKVNEVCQADLPLAAIYEAPTIAQLATLLSSGVKKSPYYSLVPIQAQGYRPPLFAIHTLTFQDLPRKLGEDQPLYFLRYGMAAEGNEHSITLPKIKSLAHHYIIEMQRIQPKGPYHLIGFSFGGIVAYEMAVQLLANGERVNFLGLLDSYLDFDELPTPWYGKIRRILRQSPARLLGVVKGKIENLLPSKYDSGFWPHFYTSEPDDVCQAGYQIPNYARGVTLFQGEEWDSILRRYALPEVRWKALLGDKLKTEHITGSHFHIFEEPHVNVLAAKITACMDQAIAEEHSTNAR